MDRSQKLVLCFLLVAELLIAGIRLIDPASLRDIWHTTAFETDLILLGLLAFIGLLAWGTYRAWRWTFWLVLIAFAFAPVRVVQATLQLTGVLETDLPAWYVAMQALLGVAQAGIAGVLLISYRRSGPWSAEVPAPAGGG